MKRIFLSLGMALALCLGLILPKLHDPGPEPALIMSEMASPDFLASPESVSDGAFVLSVAEPNFPPDMNRSPSLPKLYQIASDIGEPFVIVSPFPRYLC